MSEIEVQNIRRFYVYSRWIPVIPAGILWNSWIPISGGMESIAFPGRKRVAGDCLINNADPLLRNKKAHTEAKASQLLTAVLGVHIF